MTDKKYISKKKYIAGYMRLSDDDRDIGDNKGESNSISNQRKVLQDFIRYHQELAEYPMKEFLDDGFSGVNFNRPGIKKLLREVREGKISCVIVKDLSRFGRNYIEVGDYLEQIFPFMGVRFISITDHFDSASQFGGIEIGFKNLMHELYSKDLSKKIRVVKKMHQERGMFCGGDVPFGYQRKMDGCGAYRPDEDTAEIVQLIFRLASEGTAPAAIADYLNEHQIITPAVHKNGTKGYHYRIRNQKRNFWFSEKVREILQNEAYIGTYVCRKALATNLRETEKVERSEYLRFEHSHEALVSKEIFDAAQKVIEIRGKRGHYRKTNEENLLKGKMRCGYCGYSLNFQKNANGGIYYCRMGSSCGSHLKISVSVLENIVLELLGKMIADWESDERRKQKARTEDCLEMKKVKEDCRLMEMRAERCKTNRLILYRQWKEQGISEKEYREKRDEIAKEEEEYQRKKAELEKHIVQWGQKMEKEEGMESDYLQEYKGMDSLTREAAEKLIQRIDVYGEDRVEIGWKFLDEFEMAGKEKSEVL